MSTASRAHGCVRCAKPCALVGDTVPEDQLCPWCRGGETPGAPGASALWLGERRGSEWPQPAAGRDNP